MNLSKIYIEKKKILDRGYMEFYQILKEDIENDKDYTLADDELDELIVDLMLSNVLGRVTTFDEINRQQV